MTEYLVTQGIFTLPDPEWLKNSLPWVKTYYKTKDWNFSKIRQHALDFFSGYVNGIAFDVIYSQYISHLMYVERQERAKIANDNCILNNAVKRCGERTYVPEAFPSVKWHPMANWRGERITKFGIVGLNELIKRMGSVQIN